MVSRKDRSVNGEARGGGVAILSSRNIPIRPKLIYSPLEICAAILHPSNQPPLTIVSVYIPPNPQSFNIVEELDKVVNTLSAPYLICADFNGHHTSWGSEVPNSRGNQIHHWITKNDLTILNNMEPTYETTNGNYTHIDISVSSKDISLKFDWTVHHENLLSDHFPVIIKAIDHHFTEEIKEPRFKLSKANWGKFQASLSLPSPTFSNPTETYKACQEALMKAAEEAIPKNRSTRNLNYCKPWWTPEVAEAHRKKNEAYRRYKRNLGNIPLWIDYKRLKAKFKHLSKRTIDTSWKKFSSSITSNTSSSEVWTKVNIFRNLRSNPSIILEDQGDYIHRPQEISEKFATDFSARGCHLDVDRENWPDIPNSTSDRKYNEDFTIWELDRALKSGSSNTPGPDNLPPMIFKHLDISQKENLLNILNYFWNNSIPEQMKESIIIPLHKPGKIRTETISYRPISLTNCLSKIMERIVSNRLREFLEKENLLDDNQSGFRKGFSTYDGLSRLENAIRFNQRTKQATLVVFLDINQAFDSVNHQALLHKIECLGISGKLLHYIKNFISNRKMSVRYKGHKSTTHTNSSGVPQGSVISPLLFILMLNDLLFNLHENYHVSKFADDVAFWVNNKYPTTCTNKAQEILETLECWGKKWGLSFSPNKTKAVFFTRKKIPDISLTLNNINIEYVPNFKFLGLYYDRNLTWKPHITYLKQRCQKDLNLLRMISSQRWGADFSSLKHLYQSLILSKISYASFIYDTASTTNLKSLDAVQNNAARTMLGALRVSRVEHMEKLANLLPLNIHRKIEQFKYAIRVLANPKNPFRKDIVQEIPINVYNEDSVLTKHDPIALRIRKQFDTLKVQCEDIATTSLDLRYKSFKPLASADLHCQNKKDLDDLSWNMLFQHLTSSYPQHAQVYCDGSVAENLSGCGVWSTNFAIKARLPDHSTIFTCELYALYLAITYVSPVPGKYLILTDSLSAITSLQSPHNSSHNLILKVANLIECLNQHEIVIQWVPSHTNITGNEKADHLAKDSLKLANITKMPQNVSDISKVAPRYYKKQIRNVCNPCEHSTRISLSTKNPPPFLTAPRFKQVILSRLHLRVTKLTHLHIIAKTPPANCPRCDVEITLEHIFIHCPIYLQPRINLQSSCTSQNTIFNLDNILDGDFPTDPVWKFIQECKLEDKI